MPNKHLSLSVNETLK